MTFCSAVGDTDVLKGGKIGDDDLLHRRTAKAETPSSEFAAQGTDEIFATPDGYGPQRG